MNICASLKEKNMLKKIHQRLKYIGAKKLATLKIGLKQSGFIAHHGLQRNGTNFLLLSLKQIGCSVINEFDPPRNQPQHKHFRWYADKDLIPPVLSAEYGNTYTAKSIIELNALCRFPSDTRHIVICKAMKPALVSMLNWGLRCQWFATKEEALQALPAFKADYEAYYEFWQNLATKEPHMVQLLSFEDLLANHQLILEKLKHLGFALDQTSIKLDFDEIPQSPKERRQVIVIDDVHL